MAGLRVFADNESTVDNPAVLEQAQGTKGHLAARTLSAESYVVGVAKVEAQGLFDVADALMQPAAVDRRSRRRIIGEHGMKGGVSKNDAPGPPVMQRRKQATTEGVNRSDALLVSARHRHERDITHDCSAATGDGTQNREGYADAQKP